MKIVEVRAVPLWSRSSEAGWEEVLTENMHTLIIVESDAGLTGVGFGPLDDIGT